MRVMRFYHMGWNETMQLPLKLFWTLLGNMYRIEAQENLRWSRVFTIGNATEESRKEFIQEQINVLGTIQVSDERDEEGVDKLRQLGSI